MGGRSVIAADHPFLVRLGEVASRRPDAVALIDGTLTMTYGELCAAVDERAVQLVAAGLRTRDRVAFVAENSARFLVDAFAVWAAGGVVATIYPSSGQADIAYCIEHCDPVLVLTDVTTADRAATAIGGRVPAGSIAAGSAIPAVRSDTAPDPEGLRAPVSLICFTSGSTDRPKAIMHSADGLVGGLDAYAAMWRLDEHDVMLVCLPMAWLFGLATGSMGALLRGGTVVSTPRADPVVLSGLIARHRVTVLPAVTTIFVKLVDHLTATAGGAADLASLRFCVSGGEPRNDAVFDRWTALTGVPIHDTYCSSESFPLVTYDPLADPVPRRGSAGRLAPGCELRIVDDDGGDVEPGVVGEALCRAPGLFVGYWGEPERSAAALTADGWYRQQDLVRVDADGYVYVVGRLSDTIIRGGANVSPAEVERVLRSHPSVADACVVGLPDPRHGQQVAAAVILAQGTPLDTDDLTRFVRGHLAAYKVPTVYLAIAELPLNSTTGKVDRRAVASELAHHTT